MIEFTHFDLVLITAPLYTLQTCLSMCSVKEKKTNSDWMEEELIAWIETDKPQISFYLVLI